MLFSSPDYPVFLIAVFFLYALARWGRAGGAGARWARIAVMVLLGDVVFALVAKDVDALWDPIGGGLLRLLVGGAWTVAAAGRWLVGALFLLVGCSSLKDRHQADASPDGSKLWAQNCARCHNSRPSSDYSNEKWDVAMLHMRVRANLTAQEHKSILEFLQSGN